MLDLNIIYDNQQNNNKFKRYPRNFTNKLEIIGSGNSQKLKYDGNTISQKMLQKFLGSQKQGLKKTGKQTINKFIKFQKQKPIKQNLTQEQLLNQIQTDLLMKKMFSKFGITDMLGLKHDTNLLLFPQKNEQVKLTINGKDHVANLIKNVKDEDKKDLIAFKIQNQMYYLPISEVKTILFDSLADQKLRLDTQRELFQKLEEDYQNQMINKQQLQEQIQQQLLQLEDIKQKINEIDNQKQRLFQENKQLFKENLKISGASEQYKQLQNKIIKQMRQIELGLMQQQVDQQAQDYLKEQKLMKNYPLQKEFIIEQKDENDQIKRRDLFLPIKTQQQENRLFLDQNEKHKWNARDLDQEMGINKIKELSKEPLKQAIIDQTLVNKQQQILEPKDVLSQKLPISKSNQKRNYFTETNVQQILQPDITQKEREKLIEWRIRDKFGLPQPPEQEQQQIRSKSQDQKKIDLENETQKQIKVQKKQKKQENEIEEQKIIQKDDKMTQEQMLKQQYQEQKQQGHGKEQNHAIQIKQLKGIKEVEPIVQNKYQDYKNVSDHIISFPINRAPLICQLGKRFSGKSTNIQYLLQHFMQKNSKTKTSCVVFIRSVDDQYTKLQQIYQNNGFEFNIIQEVEILEKYIDMIQQEIQQIRLQGIDIDEDYINKKNKTFILKSILIMDDFGEDIRNNKKISKFFLNLRHARMMCILNIQTYKAQLKPKIRENIDVYILYKGLQNNVIQSIMEEQFSKNKIEQMIKYYDQLEKEKEHSFLVINLMDKNFRVNWNKQIQID